MTDRPITLTNALLVSEILNHFGLGPLIVHRHPDTESVAFETTEETLRALSVVIAAGDRPNRAQILRWIDRLLVQPDGPKDLEG